MANWDRTYNSPTVWLQPYTVEVARPAGWKPTMAADATGMYHASITGTVPGETYELPYKKDASVTAGTKDVWKLGPVYKASAERTAKLIVRNTSGTPPADPIVLDPYKPKLRDGGGGGLEEGDAEDGRGWGRAGDFEIQIGKKWYKGRFKIARGRIVIDNGYTDPSPIERSKDKTRKVTTAKKATAKKTVAKRAVTKGRRK